ncbi:MAG: cell division protein FtsI [Glaciihabitans sp.]|jgi:peptidoglycan glycosyltransferase|nr:cell division protein FtsI [Glaciihabitans sp.]MDQ1555701.1 penicillin-binding protein [Actinomycetota bacterium]
MNKELKRVSTVVLVMFLALFVSSTVIQVAQGDQLKADPRNVRTLYDSYSTERGPIVVGGSTIAESKPVKDQYKFQRVYSHGKLYAPVTGYFTLNQQNPGIEGALGQYLSGTANDQFLNNLTSIVTGQKPKGASVELTIDPKVQLAAYNALGSQRGAVVAINPKTGAILAMVSKPSYDPNALAVHNGTDFFKSYNALNASKSQPLVNRAIAGDLYHPGSVFKLIVASAAIDSGKFTANSTFPNPATLKLPQSNSYIANSTEGTCGPSAKASIATALRLSCNIPFAQLGRAVGESTIADYATRFGFGQKLSIPLPVTPSIYPRGMDEPTLMLSSFGQASDQVTPLQMAMVSSAIANGGTLMKPNLVQKVLAPDLSPLQQLTPEVFSNPISSGTASTMTRLMIDDVANGAASNATIGGVDVAGKTGTAENGPGAPYTLWFTGFAPANDPQVAVAVVVENGGGFGQSSFGNAVAAPIAKKVLEAVLNK